MSHGRLLLVSLLVFAGSAATGHAAPPWSAPENVSSPATFVDSPQVVFDGRGRAYAAWAATNGTGPSATRRWRIAVREPGATEFGPERSAPNLVTPLLLYGRPALMSSSSPGSAPASSRRA